jgi:UDPglucose--hexose-1-phosphate uridylyltransferase
MSQLRKDPIVGRWVIVAEGRAGRPNDLRDAGSGGPCPFCEGNERETPGEVLAFRQAGTLPNQPGWRVRVVPNRYPALDVETDTVDAGEYTEIGAESGRDPLYETLPGLGVHEVIIESSQHVASIRQLPLPQLAEVFSAYRQRLQTHQQDRRLAYGMLFKNVGEAAGASLEHTHSQLIVTPIVPINVQEELAGSLAFHRRHDECIYCRLIVHELASAVRVVLDRPGFVAFCPMASRFPYETWILPKRHASRYEDIQPDELRELAGVMQDVVGRIEMSLDHPAYNYLIHTAPFDTCELDHYHWHIEITPRLTRTAGFEWGTGFYINDVSPEAAAEVLRR